MQPTNPNKKHGIQHLAFVEATRNTQFTNHSSFYLAKTALEYFAKIMSATFRGWITLH